MDPLRLRHDGDDFERELLDSAGDDDPGARAREQLLAVLGVAGLAGPPSALALSSTAPAATMWGGAGSSGTGVVSRTMTIAAVGAGTSVPTVAAASATTTAASVGGSIGVHAIGASTATALGFVAVGKWLAASLLVGLGSTALMREVGAPLLAPSPTAARAAAVRVPVIPPRETPTPPAEGANNPALLAPIAATEPSSLSAPAASSATAGAVAEEIQAIDRARAALHKGDSLGAARLLRAYRIRFPKGALAPEAALLDLEATAAQGDARATQAAAQSFLDHHGSSPYAARAQTLLDQTIATRDVAATSRASGPVPAARRSSKPQTAIVSGPAAPTDPPTVTTDTPSGVARFNDTT
ncbi:MAG: hypothetical protein JW751_16395 [Polyangiaceae bacterium]|nr:hypothetical protein [Polyangiaceae bacterium]